MKYSFFGILLFTFSFLSGQRVVSATTLQTQTASSLNVLLLLSGTSVRVDYDVELVRLEYETIGSDGLPDVASGLMLYPLGLSNELPLHAHFHGTTTRDAVPSTLDGGYELGLVYAGKGHFVIMPDYIGMGVSRGFHPYVHRETQATAGLDMAFAAQEYVDSREDIALSQILTIAGYSQGGHAAMSFQQLIENQYADQFDLIASTPMSGPYDLSGQFKDFIFSNNEYFYPGYILYQLIGYNIVYGSLYENLGDILKEPYLEPAESFASTGTNLGSLQNELIDLLVENEGQSIPIKMFKDEYIFGFMEDNDHPLNVALGDNDTYNFTAQAPTRIIYCTADDQVPFKNSLTADSVLNDNGAINTSSIDISPTSDHGGCVFPAVEESLRFIGEFLKSTSTYDYILDEELVNVYPNPSVDVLNVEMIDNFGDYIQMNIFDTQARLVKSSEIRNRNKGQLNISNLVPGTYVVEISNGIGSAFRKIIKQ